MSGQDYLLLLCGMGLVTYLPRMLPMVLLAHRQLPKWTIDWLSFIPVAMLSALIAPGLFVDSSRHALSFGKLELLVAVPTLLFAAKSRSLGATVVIGMGLFWLGTVLS
ncbi:MAG: AzlD domain-containing protein [Desulfuromonas sp.]|nr:MAG: AzlD domain-containing protein [Desulfuromonas sp.]